MKTNTNAVAKSTLIVIWLITVTTIVSEVSESFNNMLIAFGGHHWVAKGIISVLAFFVLYAIFQKNTSQELVAKNVRYVVWSVVLAGFIIFLFFLFHFLKG